jgi:hypothetical protein
MMIESVNMQKTSSKKKRPFLEGSKRQELIRQIGEEALQEVIASLQKNSAPAATKKARRKSPATSTKAKSRPQATMEEDSVVKALRQVGLPVNRQNYLRAAGYADDPDPESEAMLPREFQKDPEPL